MYEYLDIEATIVYRIEELTFIFTAAFLLLCLLAAYFGLSSIQIPQVNDKALHTLTFFALTVSISAPVRATPLISDR